MTQEPTSVSGLAGRYATALFELARETDTIEAVAADLASVRAMLRESADLRRAARSPLIARAEKSAAMAALAQRARLGKPVAGFLGVAARNGRLFALEAAIRAFDALLARHRGEIDAEVVTARPLDAKRTAAIAGALARASGRHVLSKARVDETLLGGLTVRLGSRMIDASVRARLRALEAAMKGTA